MDKPNGKYGMTDTFWINKKVLITGHTGFKGSWLTLLLVGLGARVIGYSLAPQKELSLFCEARLSELCTSITGNILDSVHLESVFEEHQPDIVIHLAAQSLVRYSYDYPKETYETNVIGTLNVLDNLRTTNSVKSAIMVTTDKCYENTGLLRPYNENDPLGGYDPYSSSKACAEILVSSYRRSYFVEHSCSIATARAGNVIGGGDWAKDRLIPHLLESISNNDNIVLRNPNSTRPWQHVLDALNGYLMLAKKLYIEGDEYAQSFNFGPESKDVLSVHCLAEAMIKATNSSSQIVESLEPDLHEATELSLDSMKAQQLLGWKTCWSIDVAIVKIAEWNELFIKGENARKISLMQIADFQS
jgi:CDP-glucose 4,6-dehydratase